MTYLVIAATVVWLLALAAERRAHARDESDGATAKATPLPSPFLEDYRPQYVDGWRPDGVVDLRTADEVSAPDAAAAQPSYSYFG